MEVVIETHAIASAFAAIALDMKATNVVILDMEGLVSYTDAFVICSAGNRRQVQAIAERVRQLGKRDLGLTCLGVEGVEAARWVLVDFGDVVLHVFEEPMRPFYNLDGLWSDAKRLPLPEQAEDASQEPTAEPVPAV